MEKCLFCIIPGVRGRQNNLKRMFPVKEGFKQIGLDYTFQGSANHEKGILLTTQAFRRWQDLISGASKLAEGCVT